MAAGLTQAQLAESARTSTPFISQLERGVTTPTLGMLLRLADALECRHSNSLRSSIVVRIFHPSRVKIDDANTARLYISLAGRAFLVIEDEHGASLRRNFRRKVLDVFQSVALPPRCERV